ncbi:hypothetical protein GJ744_012406 [Endocarpon pusillum]|uniref:Uncharacterized protein n=1 Tax=Endocarpon pusillum TaxID=364733 RepID=A0A8H7ADA8_9EURO|nr:hypothetical protein GJ744_012406 [Endocarpon pusillum]
MSILPPTSKQPSTLTQPNLVSTKATGFQLLQRQKHVLAVHQSGMAKELALAPCRQFGADFGGSKL